MTTRELNETVDSLIEQVAEKADLLSFGGGVQENHLRLLNALMEACDREAQHLENYSRPLRLQEEANELKMETYRKAA